MSNARATFMRHAEIVRTVRLNFLPGGVNYEAASDKRYCALSVETLDAMIKYLDEQAAGASDSQTPSGMAGVLAEISRAAAGDNW